MIPGISTGGGSMDMGSSTGDQFLKGGNQQTGNSSFGGASNNINAQMAGKNGPSAFDLTSDFLQLNRKTNPLIWGALGLIVVGVGIYAMKGRK